MSFVSYSTWEQFSNKYMNYEIGHFWKLQSQRGIVKGTRNVCLRVCKEEVTEQVWN